MRCVTGKRSLTAIFCLVAIGVSGCSEFGEMPAWVPFQGPVSDELPGVVTPAQRIARLRKLSDNAAWKKPGQKRQIAEELAAAFHSEEDTMIQAEIVRSLGKYPGPAADTVLKEAVHHKDADVRVAACEVLGKRGGAEATAVLAGLLGGDVDADVRLAAARALGEGKDPAAVAALGRALEDTDPAMQYRAVLSLQTVTGKDFGNDVNQWRQYVKGETPKPAQPVSIAERLRQMF
jgi:hypothetical protein